MKTRIPFVWAALLVASLVSVAEAQVPIILAQPTNAVVLAGGTASFSVSVSGTGPLAYQWQFNGTNLPDGDISTVAGNGTNGYSGDGGLATKAELAGPVGVAVDASGNLFIADYNNNRIREVGTNGMITTVAGNGTNGYSGDGGLATKAELYDPWGVAVDASGNLFIADWVNNRIREVGTNGMISTVAGNGTNGYSGDGGPAIRAELNYPVGVAVDAFGNLFIADWYNNRIREVGTNGMISTVAGNGTNGYSGDGSAATNAELGYSYGVAVDAFGNLFIADTDNYRIREVGTNGRITTVAGNGTPGYSGDGGRAINAELDGSYGVAVDASGNLFMSDYFNQRICEVVFPGPTLVLPDVGGANAGAYDVVVSSLYGSVTSSVVTLVVLLPPAIVAQPQSQAVVVGSNATLSVVASGTAPLDYQWYFDGMPLPGQTNTTLLLSAAAFTNAGSYNVVVTNLYGSVTSAVAIVIVGIPPVITEQPVSRTNLVQSTASFSVAVTGTGPFTYQWQFNGTNLPNGVSASPTLVLNNVTAANAGSYDVVVSSPYGSVTSSIVTLQLLFPSTIVTQPQSEGVALGSNATFSVVASGTAPLDYQWYFDGAPLAGQTNTTLLLRAVASTNAGSYTVVVTNYYGSITSAVATLIVGMPTPPGVTVRFVNASNPNPTPPYTSWATAATDIQPAVNAAGAGDWILVFNGVYNPVTVNTPLTFQSVNGPGVTIINGGGWASCLYLANNAVVAGFTLTNGYAYQGGGVYCDSTNAVLTNCVLAGNSGNDGGGAYGGTLNNCTLTGNSVVGYYTGWRRRYYVPGIGGGANACTLNNCTLTGNSSSDYGGGASDSTLNNCTLSGNSATTGGGADSCALNNCIVYFNSDSDGGNYDASSTLNYCCTTPMPTNGVGNISVDPELASASHLSAESPCIGAGSSLYVSGTDIDGDAWNNPPSIGCEEYHAGAVTGPLTVSLTATFTNVATGFPVGLTALIAGRTDLSVWDFGDGDVQVNEPYTSHAWTAPGDYLVSLWAYNDTYPEGVSAMMTIHVEEGLHYVAATNVNPVAPYTSWATAATNIQDAVNVAPPGATVFVTNGVYATGGATDPNGNFDLVVVDEPLTIRSVNGPAVTVIDGGGSASCLYLTNGAVLVGFTLTNGFNYNNGGGAYCQSTSAVLTNCVLTGNSAWSYGGGAYGGTLNNCTLTNNSVPYGGGGGACDSTLNNCTLTGNSAWEGGGVADSTLNNCMLTGNSAQWEGGGAYSDSSQPCTLNNCTLTDNTADYGGGGACDSTLNNCALTGNTADYEGGGAYSDSSLPCTLNNCTLTDNTADYGGGGACDSTLNNCALSGNTADNVGGGAYSDGYQPCTLNNCTLTGNSATGNGAAGGGAYFCTLDNCILYYNDSAGTDANYDESCTLNYFCTAPLPAGGGGNISADPQLASAWLLSAHSPCIGAGSTAYVSGTDIDGEPWASPPSMGCEEFYAGAMVGPLTVAIEADYTNVVPGLPLNFTALIVGLPNASSWDFGDGTVVSNLPYASHAWKAIGDYPVILRAYNDSQPAGVAASVTIHVIVPPVQYVTLNSTSSVPPYGSWATAATNIQEAVDAVSVPGTVVLVSNGVYQAGLTVTMPLTVQSLNGPGVTMINGGGTQECVYLTNGAVLVGFTLTNGWASQGGGVYCESSSAVLSNCVLTGNSAYDQGGGAYGGTLNNCTLSGNSATGESYGDGGGGAADSTLNNCALTGNTADYEGGGAYSDGNQPCTLNNCNLTGNSASDDGGGAYSCTLNNCIVYFNTDPNDGGNYDPSSTLNYCCTTPLPTNGVGNISADPRLASASHLSAESPCIRAGSSSYVSGTDIDGDAWANPPSIGCDEYHAGAVTGPLTVNLTATLTNVVINYRVGLTALIAGRTDLSIWDFGDGYVQVNEPYTSHIWTVPGDYLVALWAFSDSYPEGVSAVVTIHVEEGLHYVSASSGNPAAPYTSWATAARNIQDAVDVAPPGATIFVTNGIYAPVTVNTPLTVRSVNGPGVTVINGSGTVRCLYLTNDTVMVGFTLTNGWALSGGGVYCESTSAVLTNCVLTGNWAYGGEANGGGAYGGTLNNCTLTGNSALYIADTFSTSYGGGAEFSTLNNCTLTGNWAEFGGGADGSTLNNCTVTGNSAYNGAGGAYYCTLNNCIMFRNPHDNDSGSPGTQDGNDWIGDPLFVDYAGGNLRLQSNSPCINAGNNAYVVGSTDLDGNPRIVGGTVDIGAYEYQTPVSMISYAWLQQYGLPINTNTDTADLDGTGMNLYQDWVAGLNPTNALSVLKMLAPAATNSPLGLVVSWQSVSNITYFLQRSTNLAAQPAFSTIQSNIVGQAGTTSYTDTTATNAGPYFYRVGVGY